MLSDNTVKPDFGGGTLNFFAVFFSADMMYTVILSLESDMFSARAPNWLGLSQNFFLVLFLNRFV